MFFNCPKNGFTVQSADFAGSAESFQTFVYLCCQDKEGLQVVNQVQKSKEKYKKSKKDSELFGLVLQVSIQNMPPKLRKTLTNFQRSAQSQSCKKTINY